MFKVRPFETKTLSWWNSERDNIDMAPPYQRRGNLWSPTTKAYLIDSILNEYDVPKVYIADFTYVNTPLNTNNKLYAVIDGKQRLQTIFDFFDGNLLLNNDFVFFEDKSLKLGNLSYKDLKTNYPKIASRFENFNLSVMSVITDDEAKINDLFVRLNSSKPLTGAELRNAMKGPVPNIIRTIANHDFFKNKVKFSFTRGADQNTAAKLLLVEFVGDFVDTKKSSLNQLVDIGLQAENSAFERAVSNVNKNLDIMAQVFTTKDPLLASQGPVPLYYLFVRDHLHYLDKIREFLIDFERNRLLNQKAIRDPSVIIDNVLQDYDIYNRSVNDRASLVRRYEILNDRFERFLSSRP
jgi:hypothetical protein